MPRNGSGTYTLPAGNPVVSGDIIESSWANSTLSDLADSMTNSLARNGEGGMTAALRVVDGTVTVPGLAFANETGSGLYRAAAGDVGLSVLGARILRLQAAGAAVTGTLGVSGDTTFSGQLNTFVNSTAYYPQLVQRNTTADSNASYLLLEKNRNGAIVSNGDILGNIAFRGYDGATYLQGAAIFARVSATPGTNDMPTDLVFGTTADGGAGITERMVLNQAGNVGIGVTPSANDYTGVIQFRWTGHSLTPRANNDFVMTMNSISSGGGVWRYANTARASLYLQSDGNHIWSTAPSGTAGNAISYSQAMTLDSSGNLSVGATTVAAKITSIQSADFVPAIVASHLGPTSGVRGIAVTTPNYGGADGYMYLGSAGGNDRFYVRTSGNVQNSNNSYGAISDIKLKENIVDASPKLEKLNQVRVVNYNLIGDEQKQIGVIAQELESIFPSMVEEMVDRDKEGKDLGTTTKSVKYSVFVPMLIKAIQEQQALITQLQADVAALKA
jgi:hypothetical protein